MVNEECGWNTFGTKDHEKFCSERYGDMRRGGKKNAKRMDHKIGIYTVCVYVRVTINKVKQSIL